MLEKKTTDSCNYTPPAAYATSVALKKMSKNSFKICSRFILFQKVFCDTAHTPPGNYFFSQQHSVLTKETGRKLKVKCLESLDKRIFIDGKVGS